MPTKKQLWESLNSDGLYTKPFADFDKQFSNDEAIASLHKNLQSDQLYTKDLNSFKQQFFSDVKKKEPTVSSSQSQGTGSSSGSAGTGTTPQLGSFGGVSSLGLSKTFQQQEQRRAQQTPQKEQTTVPKVAKPQERAKQIALNEEQKAKEELGNVIEESEQEPLTTKEISGYSNADSYINFNEAVPDVVKDFIVSNPLLAQSVGAIYSGIETGIASAKKRGNIDYANSENDFDDVNIAELARANRIESKRSLPEDAPFWQKMISTIVSSAVSMAATTPKAAKEGVVGFVTAGPAGVLPSVAGATSLGLEYSSSFLTTLQEKGYDITTEQGLRSAFADKEAMEEARQHAMQRGIPIGIIDGITAGVAGLAYKGTAKALAKTSLSQASKTAIAATAEVGAESVLGASGELAGQVASGEEIDPEAIAMEGLAEIVVGAPSLSYQYLKSKSKSPAQTKYVDLAQNDAYIDVKDFAANISNPELAKIKKNIDRLTKLKNEAKSDITKSEATAKIDELKAQYFEQKNKSIESFADIDEAKGEELVALKSQIEKTIEDRNNSESQAEKEFLDNVLQKQKEEFLNAVQKQTTSEVPVQPEAGSSGEVAEGAPQAEPQVVTEEGQKEIVIDKPSIVNNTVPEVEAVKMAAPETETGQTFNLDGTVYDQGGLIVPIASENLSLSELTPERIADFVEKNTGKIGEDSVKVGIYKFPNSDQASIDLNIAAPREFRDVAIEFGRKAGQESLFDADTFENVKTGADGTNPMQFTDEQFKEVAKALKQGRMPSFLIEETPVQKAAKTAFPNMRIVEVENAQQMKQQVAEQYGREVADTLADDDAARVVFKGDEADAIYINKELADKTTLPHEVWHPILVKAFGQDQALFKSFRDQMDKVLRENGYEYMADRLDQFAANPEYVENGVDAEEWLAQLGALMTNGDIDVNNLNPQQKTLLDKIKDIINAVAQKVLGRPVFDKNAKPADILNFMSEVSTALAKGEDISGYFKAEEVVKNTEDVFNSKAQKIGDFDIDYFEDAEDFKKLEEQGYVIQNSSIDKISGQPVAVHQPDSLLVGNVKYNGKQIIDGNGGVYYTLKFGNVWASGKKTSASGLAKLINKSRKNSSDGKGRLLLVMGSRDKMISSVQGVKASMEIVENLVFDGLIARSDFRKALTIAGKKYNIDFSGSDSSSAIKKDISDKFMNVNDSSFQRRGDFFSDLITEIGKTESATKNIKKIQKALGATKNISFSKQGIRNQIGTVLSERLTQGVPSGNYYAYIEVDDDVDIIEDKQHESYPWSIVQKNGKRPVLHILNERLKATENISKEDGSPASNAELGLAQRGMGYGVVSNGITTKAQKVNGTEHPGIPQKVADALTEDGKGNYVFRHYSKEKRSTIKPSSGSGSLITSPEEQRAIASVGGVAMYYTMKGQQEQGVGDVVHTVVIPKNKVYYLQDDVEGFFDEAKEQFLDYMNKNNKKRVEYAFEPNYQAAWIAKVAGENGYDMLVSNWRNGEYRAQTTKEFTPEAEVIDFKTIEEHDYQPGDKANIFGRESTIIDRNGSLLTYGWPSPYGGMNTGKFDLEDIKNSGKISLIEAAPKVTTKAQKASELPGYKETMGKIDGIIAKSIERGNDTAKATQNAIDYLQKSALYERASDTQRDEMIRDMYKQSGKRLKSAPSIERLFGITDEKVTVSEKQALKDQIKLEQKAAKNAVAFVKDLRMSISMALEAAAKRGKISATNVARILKRYDSMNVLNPVMRERFFNYVERAFKKADYLDRLSEANKLRSRIKKAAKNDESPANMSNLAKEFARINPSMLEDVDQYVERANMIMGAITRLKGPREAVNEAEMTEYINKEIESQEKQAKDALLAQYEYLVDAGIISEDMPLDTIQKLIEAIEKNAEVEGNRKGAEETLMEMAASMMPIISESARTLVDPLTGEQLDLTEAQVKTLKQLTLIDPKHLSLSTLYRVVEAMNNFITNGSVDGLENVVREAVGNESAFDLKDAGVKSRTLTMFKSKAVGELWAKYLAPLPILNKLLWASQSVITQVGKGSGLNEFVFNKALAINKANAAIERYLKLFANKKDFFAADNMVERGMLAFMSRTVAGDAFSKQAEFTRRKKLIEETISALQERSDSESIEKAKIYEEVYNKIVKDSRSIEDLKSKVSETNNKAVEWWINEWKNYFPKMQEVSRSVYNTILDRDENFTPDRFQKMEESVVSAEAFESAYIANNDVVDTEKSGSLKKNKRINALPENAIGEKTRIVNLDFDMVNSNALISSLVDIYTAGAVSQMKGFMGSKALKTLFSDTDTMNVFKDRIINYVALSKGNGYAGNAGQKQIMRIVNTLASLGVTKALAKLSMPFAQTIPTFAYSFIVTGRTGVADVFPSWDALSKSGMPISNRGVGSRAELETLNKKIKIASDNVLKKGVDAIVGLNEAMLELQLQYPDAFAARAAWIAYYKQYLNKKGVKGPIDWSNHKFDADAAEYAEQMQTAHQNVNDTDMLGMFMTDRSPGVSIARKMIFPMMGFAINAKSRLWSDTKTVTSKTVSNEERLLAAKGIAATVAEILVYRALLFAFAELWQSVSNAITGEPDDDEDKKKRAIRALANTTGNIVNDLFVPPVPGLDIVAYSQINKVLEATGLDSTLPDKLGVDNVSFKLYDKPDQDFFEKFGTVGIGPAKIATWMDYTKMAATGKYDIEVSGKKIEKKLSEEDQELAQINAALYTVYILGAPGDIDAVVRKNDKTLKTRGLTEKQAKVQRKVGAADYKIMRENDIKSERQLMLFKALGKKQYQEYKAREKQIREARKKLREGL